MADCSSPSSLRTHQNKYALHRQIVLRQLHCSKSRQVQFCISQKTLLQLAQCVQQAAPLKGRIDIRNVGVSGSSISRNWQLLAKVIDDQRLDFTFSLQDCVLVNRVGCIDQQTAALMLFSFCRAA